MASPPAMVPPEDTGGGDGQMLRCLQSPVIVAKSQLIRVQQQLLLCQQMPAQKSPEFAVGKDQLEKPPGADVELSAKPISNESSCVQLHMLRCRQILSEKSPQQMLLSPHSPAQNSPAAHYILLHRWETKLKQIQLMCLCNNYFSYTCCVLGKSQLKPVQLRMYWLGTSQLKRVQQHMLVSRQPPSSKGSSCNCCSGG